MADTETELLRGVRVVLVEDDEDARTMLTFGLERHGAKVWAAASAQEAIELVEQVKPHVMVSDIGLPGEDGYSLMRRVRALRADKGGQTPAAAVTAFTEPEDRLRAFDAGYEEYVAKPVEPHRLVALVANLAREAGYIG